MADRATQYRLYQRVPGLVLGFHGCDKKVAEEVLSQQDKHLRTSENDYDWLGHGIYFWENDPLRAMEFAVEAKNNPRLTRGRIETPAVVGAVIDLGVCLNLMDRTGLQELAAAHNALASMFDKAERPLPVNAGKERAARMLDCAVIEFAHAVRDKSDPNEGIPTYDTVRGAFWEGGELFPGACIESKNHVQIAVRHPDTCILGYFRPRA